MNNAITWFEIPAVNFDRAVTFYDTILGQPLRRGAFNEIPHGFVPADEQAVSGAVVLVPDYQPGENGAVIYLNAGFDLDGILSRVEAAGGKVVMPKLDITPQGYMAHIVDTEGNRVGLHQPPMA